MGTPKGEISRKLIDDFGLTKSRVQRHLRKEYKQPEKVEAGSKGGRPRMVVSRETRTLQEIDPEYSTMLTGGMSSRNVPMTRGGTRGTRRRLAIERVTPAESFNQPTDKSLWF